MSALEQIIRFFEDEGSEGGAMAYTAKQAAAELTRYKRLLELARAVNKTGGVVVEYAKFEKDGPNRPLRDWITEYLNEIDAPAGQKAETK